MKSALQAVLLLLLASCSASSEANQGSGQSATANSAAQAALPRTYWPLDSTLQQTRIVLPGPLHYEVVVVTKCLNDSLVVNRILLDDGPALDLSHNYESEISINRKGHAWQQVTLTKALFLRNPEVRKLDSLSALVLSQTAFVGYKEPDFYFTTRLRVPDSDEFVEAKLAFTPGQNLRVVNVREETEAK